jgi:hypothetical protein
MLSPADLASRVNELGLVSVSGEDVERWEGGGDISPFEARLLAEALGRSAAWLYGISGTEALSRSSRPPGT